MMRPRAHPAPLFALRSMAKVVTQLLVVVSVVAAFTGTGTGTGGGGVAHGFTLSATDQLHVRDCLEVLDRRVRVYIDLKANTFNPDPAPVFDACLATCRALTQPVPDGDAAAGVPVPVPVPLFRPKEEEPQAGELLTHFFGVRLWDAELESLRASSVTAFADPDRPDRDGGGEDLSERLMDAADVVTASANFVLLPLAVKTDALDALDAAVAHEDFLDARRTALAAAACFRDPSSTAVTGETITDKDERVVAALYDTALHHLGPQFLTPRGFPCTRLGLRGFAAAARAGTDTQRAAAALGRIWHAAQEAGPLIVVPNRDAAAAAAAACAVAGAGADDGDGGGGLEDYTLVVAFSALGWNGVVRPEWGGTLRTASNPNRVVVAHALDSCKSWFTTNPLTGDHDNGAWWDMTLAELASPFGTVCIVGESMGGAAALRFARHATDAGTVVSFVPQIDLKDFASLSVRDDLVDAHKDRLLASIRAATAATTARVVIHVGRNSDDLRQLTYIDAVVHEHAALGLQVDAPLPRYSSRTSHAVGNHRLRVVKHDLDGHAMGAGLKAKGTLRDTVLDDLLGTDAWQYTS